MNNLVAPIACFLASIALGSSLSVFQMRLVLDTPSADSEQMTLVKKQENRSYTNVFSVQKAILLDQTALESAKASTDAFGHPIIEIVLTDQGRKKFAEVTRQNVGRRLAIIIGGKLYEAPIIKSVIPGGKAQISGDFDEPEAKALAEKINDALTQQ